MLAGGCFCGAVRYEATGEPYARTYCHCSVCRRTTGAPFVAWFSVKLRGFRILSGELESVQTSATGARSFCKKCGTQLTFRNSATDEIDVTSATLDDPASVAPEDHVWTSSKLPWVALCDGLPQYERARN